MSTTSTTSVAPAPAPPPASELAEPERPSRLRAILLAPLRWIGLLLVPDRAIPDAITHGRYAGPMLLATVAGLIAALLVAGRVDVSKQVFDELPEPPAANSGPPAAGSSTPPAMSEREIDEALAKARTVEQVKAGMSAGARPIGLLMFALALYLLARYVGGKPTYKKTLALACASAMPGVVRSVLIAVAASRRSVIAPDDVQQLVWPKLHLGRPLVDKLLAGVDPFTLWSLAIVALGLPLAASMSRRRAVVTVLVGFALWLALTQLVLQQPSHPPHPPGAPA